MNINTKTKTPYGYITANSLDDYVVDQLLYGSQAIDETYIEYAHDIARGLGYDGSEPAHWLEEHHPDMLEQYEAYEPIISGEYEDVLYQSSWMGGALCFWVFESPVTTEKARRASPCVPGAAILDTLDGDEYGYDVPVHWRSNK